MSRLKRAGVLAAGVLSLCTLLLVGCGQTKEPEVITESTISVSDKGVITMTLIGDFDKARYDINELSSKVMQETTNFNSSHKTEGEEGTVTVVAVEPAADGSTRVSVTFQFKNARVFKEYNGTDFFYGTVGEAHEAGYDLDIELVDVKENTTIGKKEIYDMGTRHILIMEDKMRLICPKSVLYLSEGATLEGKTVDASGVEGLTYVIMK